METNANATPRLSYSYGTTMDGFRHGRSSLDDGGRGGYLSLEEHPPLADRDDRGCNTLSFKRFSRSVRLAQQATRSPTPTGSVGGGASGESPATEDTPIVPPQRRQWHHTSNDVIGLLDMVKESAVLLSLLFLTSALAFTSVALSWGPTAVFTLCFCGLVPLAVLLGDLTEVNFVALCPVSSSQT
jgi:hypothetical protein